PSQKCTVNGRDGSRRRSSRRSRPLARTSATAPTLASLGKSLSQDSAQPALTGFDTACFAACLGLQLQFSLLAVEGRGALGAALFGARRTLAHLRRGGFGRED